MTSSENSIQIQERKLKSVREVNMELKLHKTKMINFSPLYDGLKYECECGHDSIRLKNIYQHIEEKFPAIFNCKNCNSKKIMQDFQDDKVPFLYYVSNFIAKKII